MINNSVGVSIELEYVESQLIMNKKEKKYKVSQKVDLSRLKTRKDGRVYIYIDRDQYIAPTEEKLIEKLYDLYYGIEQYTFTDLLPLWLIYRRDNTKTTTKTIKDNDCYFRLYIKDTILTQKPIKDLTVQDYIEYFETLTKGGLYTRKKFNDIKSVISGLLYYAIRKNIVSVHLLKSIDYKQFIYKNPSKCQKPYSSEERKTLMQYLEKSTDVHDLALFFAFNFTLRIGELKALRWTDINSLLNQITVERQILEEQELEDDLTYKSRKHNEVNHIKGNTQYGARTFPLSPSIQQFLKKLDSDTEYLFMYQGRTLITTTINRHLKKACEELNIPYRSSHKIRFSNASHLYNSGMPLTQIQYYLGHSNLSMTLHYLKDIMTDSDKSDLFLQAFS